MGRNQLKIGVFADCFRLPGDKGIRKAAELGADGVQIFVSRGPYEGSSMTRERIRDLRCLVRDLGLEISALCGDLGKGFLDPETSPEILEKTTSYLDLANALEVPILTSHVGWLPEDRQADEWKTGVAAMQALAEHAEKAGIIFASETGAEPANCLRAFIESVDSPWIRVNFDPANFIICGTDEPIQAFRTLAPYVVHTHAKDAAGKGNEVPLGQGRVPFPDLIRAYAEMGYDGYLAIERESGDDPVRDIAEAIAYLRSICSTLG